MNIGERHIRKFRRLLKKEGLATAKFELLDVAWTHNGQVTNSRLFTEKNVAALENIAALTKNIKIFREDGSDTDFWFSRNGSPDGFYYSRIYSRRGVTIAVFCVSADVAAKIKKNYVELTISSYIDGGDYILKPIMTSDGSSEQITDIATKILESKITVVSNNPDECVEFLLSNNNEVLLLELTGNDRITVRLSKVEAL